MHDPITVAHEIKYPWWKYRPWPKDHLDKAARCCWDNQTAWNELADKRRRVQFWKDGYRESFITIWHVDPELDGTDDSCGYSVSKLPREMRDRLKALVWNEARNPYYLKIAAQEYVGTRTEAESLYRGLLIQVARYARIPLTFEQAARQAAETIHHPDCIDPANVFCFQPGYHTNCKTDDREERERYFLGIVCNLARWMLRDRRPWYRHPKWHFWHWQIQIHPTQQLRHWLFDRCEKCRARFRWNEPVTSTCWDRPRSKGFARLAFWRTRTHIQCENCSGSCGVAKQASAASVTEEKCAALRGS